MDIGVAYYPEHWPESRWAEDFELMQRAGLTRVRMAEFAWCRLEPREGEFDFSWLERAVELAADHGLKALLCTPTQAPPPWLSVNYPETRPWTPEGQPYAQGSRRHVDAASPAYRYFAVRIAREMAGHFGSDPRVWGWQLDNEIGAHTHFASTSTAMQVAFRSWLRRKYGTVDALNQAWGLIFWSGEVREWDEVELLTTAPTGLNPAYLKDVRTFGQELWVDFLLEQYRAMKPLVGEQPIMHNVAWYGEQIDIWRMGAAMDVAGIDMYQSRAELVTAVDDLYRASAGAKPWAVLEMGGGPGYWVEGDQAGERPGTLTAALVRHAIAGACLSSLFRFQPSLSGSEQAKEMSAGGLRDAFGRPDTTVAETRAARDIIDRLSDYLSRPIEPSRIAIVWDTDDLIWSEMWPIMGRKRILFSDYPREIQEVHHQLTRRGARPTFTRFGAARAMGLLLPLVPSFMIHAMIKRLLVTWQHPENALFTDGAVLLNQDGERFCDETKWPEREIAVASQPGKVAYILLDKQLIDRYSQWPHFISTVPEIAYAYVGDYLRMRPDVAIEASTLEELAARRSIGSDSLHAAVSDESALPLKRPLAGDRWVLLGPVKAYFTTTEDGAAIDRSCRVLDERDRPVPGLYAVGKNGLGGQILWGHGLHIAWAMTSGRLVGTAIRNEQAD